MNARYSNGLRNDSFEEMATWHGLKAGRWRSMYGGMADGTMTGKPFSEVYIAGVRRRQADCERRRY